MVTIYLELLEPKELFLRLSGEVSQRGMFFSELLLSVFLLSKELEDLVVFLVALS